LHPTNFITTNREAWFLLPNTTCGEAIAAKTSAGTVLTMIKNADLLQQITPECLTCPVIPEIYSVEIDNMQAYA